MSLEELFLPFSENIIKQLSEAIITIHLTKKTESIIVSFQVAFIFLFVQLSIL